DARNGRVRRHCCCERHDPNVAELALDSILDQAMRPGLVRRLLRFAGSERGMTLLETVIACGILLVVMLGLLSMAALATTYTENHGHLEARTTEYAQDKRGQLLALAYTDAFSNTVLFPAAPSGGTGLGVGGSVNTAAPVDGYVDWLQADGELVWGGRCAPFTCGL